MDIIHLNLLFILEAVVEILTLILPTREAIVMVIMKYIMKTIYEIFGRIKQCNCGTSCGVYVGGPSYGKRRDRFAALKGIFSPFIST